MTSHTRLIEGIARSLIGDSRVMRELRATVAKVAVADIPVLIEGPTGSGKELVARALHDASGRTGQYVPVNVCAIADTLVEDALFGHVRGAFTGATSDAAGYLMEAHRGTLFLDEIGSLPMSSQVKLLRVIEDRVFRPVGGRQDSLSDFRLVSATNSSLERLVVEHHFRHDLIPRLAGIVIVVPALNERIDDVPALVAHFIGRRIRPGAPPYSVTPAAMRLLQSYDWPLNVREVRNVVDRALTLAEGSYVLAEDVARALGVRITNQTDDGEKEFERKRWRDLLTLYEGNTAQIAEHVGSHRATVYRRMKMLGLTPSDWDVADDCDEAPPEPQPMDGAASSDTRRSQLQAQPLDPFGSGLTLQ